MSDEATLRKIHGDGNCHICGRPKAGRGLEICSYPHGMFPNQRIAGDMWSWRPLPDDKKTPEDKANVG